MQKILGKQTDFPLNFKEATQKSNKSYLRLDGRREREKERGSRCLDDVTTCVSEKKRVSFSRSVVCFAVETCLWPASSFAISLDFSRNHIVKRSHTRRAALVSHTGQYWRRERIQVESKKVRSLDRAETGPNQSPHADCKLSKLGNRWMDGWMAHFFSLYSSYFLSPFNKFSPNKQILYFTPDLSEL